MNSIESSAAPQVAASECGLVCDVALIGLIAVGTWWGLKKLFGKKEH